MLCDNARLYFFSEVSQYFSNIMDKESDISASIAAITTLLKLLEHDKCKYTQKINRFMYIFHTINILDNLNCILFKVTSYYTIS